jgi:hypothetical protein
MMKTGGRPGLLAAWAAQLRALRPVLIAAYIPTLLAVAAALVVSQLSGVPMRRFFIDTVSEFNAPMYVGLFSNFGVVLWCGAASVCLFGGWLLLKRPGCREPSWFLLCAGLISAMLMFDDLYLLHEELLPDHTFIPQKLVFAVYGVVLLVFLARFRNLILSTRYLLLLFAFGFLAASAYIDLFVTPENFLLFGRLPGRYLCEEGLKLFGIVSWATYFICTCAVQVGSTLAKGAEP